jgi:hypothetical protein
MRRYSIEMKTDDWSSVALNLFAVAPVGICAMSSYLGLKRRPTQCSGRPGNEGPGSDALGQQEYPRQRCGKHENMVQAGA